MTRGLGGGRMFQKTVQQQLDAKIIDAAAKKDRRGFARQDRRVVKNFAGGIEHGQFLR